MSNLAFLVSWPLLEKGRLPGTARAKEQPAVAALGSGICGLKCRQNAAGACLGTPSPRSCCSSAGAVGAISCKESKSYSWDAEQRGRGLFFLALGTFPFGMALRPEATALPWPCTPGLWRGTESGCFRHRDLSSKKAQGQLPLENEGRTDSGC